MKSRFVVFILVLVRPMQIKSVVYYMSSTSQDTEKTIKKSRHGHYYNVSIKRIPHGELSLLSVPRALVLPKVVDLRSKFPAPYDQGELGSCTANALCGVVQYDLPALQGSRLFVYYNERQLEGTINEDAGALLSDGVRTLQRYGVCQESVWPYDISKFAIKPAAKAYTHGAQHKALVVKNILNDLSAMKNSLAAGHPFVVGIMIFESFETEEVAKTGVVPMPEPEKEECLGGHAIVCVGYNDDKKQWIMRNSWGSTWGDAGYFYLPYAYLVDSDLSSDLWNIKSVHRELNTTEL